LFDSRAHFADHLVDQRRIAGESAGIESLHVADELLDLFAGLRIAREFLDFIVHNKIWWMTPIIVVLALLVALILFAESSPVLPFMRAARSKYLENWRSRTP